MNVLITGASGGLGTAVASAFLDTGANVIGVADLDGAGSLYGDFRRSDDRRRLRCEVEQALAQGPIDALVHILGGFAGGRPVAETERQTWDQMMNLNLSAAFYAMRAALKPMPAAPYGRIVAVGSRAAVEPMPNFAAYAVSKAALVALVKNVASGGKGFRHHSERRSADTIDTPQNRKAMPNSDFSRWVEPESIAKLWSGLPRTRRADVSGAVIPIYGRA